MREQVNVEISAPTRSNTAPLDIEEVWERHGATVTCWAARLGGAGVDTRDVVQEVFLVAQRRLSSFRGDDDGLRGWLFRIVQNVARHQGRKAWLGGWFSGAGETAEFADPSPLPDAQLSQAQDIATARRAMQALPESLRTVLVLFELEGLSGQAIAELTGLKLATVWVRLHRARTRFLETLQRLELREERP